MSWRQRSRGRSYGYGGFAPYVPVAERRAKAAKMAKNLAAKGQPLQPVQVEGRKIALTFWGNAWCDNLESYSDFSNRLPRGRTYVRNGSVLHLEIRKGEIEAMVSGSSIYKIKIGIKPVKKDKWAQLCRECAGSIGSLVELLGGRLSERVMGVMTHRENGLFPSPTEITLDCSCPDWADMCKHVAAVLYGVGARLDQKPELLFLLRHVDHNDLVSQAANVAALTDAPDTTNAATLDDTQVADVFGIEMADAPLPGQTILPAKPAPKKKAPAKPSGKTPQTPAPKRKLKKKTPQKPPARRSAKRRSKEKVA